MIKPPKDDNRSTPALWGEIDARTRDTHEVKGPLAQLAPAVIDAMNARKGSLAETEFAGDRSWTTPTVSYEREITDYDENSSVLQLPPQKSYNYNRGHRKHHAEARIIEQDPNLYVALKILAGRDRLHQFQVTPEGFVTALGDDLHEANWKELQAIDDALREINKYLETVRPKRAKRTRLRLGRAASHRNS